jgi:hypothetical protein
MQQHREVRPSQHSVTIVVDRAFGAKLDELSEQMHVWIVDTPENRSAATRVWARSNGQSALENGVTTFEADLNTTPEQNAAAILPVVEEHHGVERHDPPCTRIEVFGARLESGVRSTFETWGYTDVSARPGGFVARKR